MAKNDQEQPERKVWIRELYIAKERAEHNVHTMLLLEEAEHWREEALRGLPYLDENGDVQRAKATEASLREIDAVIADLKARIMRCSSAHAYIGPED